MNDHSDEHVQELNDRAADRDRMLQESLATIRKLHRELRESREALTDDLDAATLRDVVVAVKSARCWARWAFAFATVALLLTLVL